MIDSDAGFNIESLQMQTFMFLMFFFYHIIDIRDEPAQPGPLMTLFDELFLSQCKRPELEIFTQFDYRF